MANSDKNIVITPNTGSASYPTIAFTGSNASPITMSILDTGALSFSGTSGQLFSIVDSLSGSIFSVNDISGIPSVEVLDTGLVKLNQYGGNTTIGVATPYTGQVSSNNARLSISSASTTTAGLIVKGKPSQTENLVEFYRSSSDASPSFKIQAGTYPVFIDNLAVGSNVYANYQIVGGTIMGNMGNVLHQFSSWNTSWATVGVKGVASQTANLQEWQNSAGTVLSSIKSDGSLKSGIVYTSQIYDLTDSGTYLLTGQYGWSLINRGTAGNTIFTIKGMSGQTGDLQQLQNSSGFSILTVNAAGNLILGNQNVASNNYIDFVKAGGGGTGGLAGIRFGSPTLQHTLTIDTGNANLVLAHQNATSAFIVRGYTSHSANLQEWQSSDGTIVAAISASGGTSFRGGYNQFPGDLRAGTYSYYDAELSVQARVAGEKGIAVRGAASQTANLQEWQNSSGTAMFSVQSDGSLKWSDSVSGPGTFWWGTHNIGGFGNDAGVGNTWNFVPYANNRVAVIVQGASSQTADLQQWRNSAGTVLASVTQDGDAKFRLAYVGTTVNYGAMFNVNTFSAGNYGIVVKGVSGQTGDLQQWQNSSGNVLAKVDKDGNFTANNFPSDAWTSYTPSLRTQTGIVSLGNGSITGAYKVVGKTCFFRLKFTIGSSTSIGANPLVYGLPVTAKSAEYHFNATMLDNGNAWYGGIANGLYLGSTTEFVIIYKESSGTTWGGQTNTAPFSLLDGDYVSVSGSYEVA